MNNAYLRIGQIVRAHGVRGAVKVNPETDDAGRFRTLKEAFLEERGSYRPVTVSGVKLLNDGVALQISGIADRDAAEALRGVFLCVDREHAVSLPEGRWFVADLIGCKVSDTNGREYGCLTDVLEMPANDVYEIEHGKLMVPALKRLIHNVDVAAGTIVFDAAVLEEVGLFED